jgi:hypothetical protein
LAVIVFLVAAAIAVGIVMWATRSLTASIRVVNDTPVSYEITGCGDPVTVSSRATSFVEVNSYETSHCQLFRNSDTGSPDGCLTVTKAEAKSGKARFVLSSTLAAPGGKTCPP